MDKLHLGVGRQRITPPIGGQLYGYRPDLYSESLADDLTATALYFSQGDTRAVMVSATVCLIQTALCREIRALLAEKLSVPPENCVICATHTHSGPNTGGTKGWGDLDRAYCDSIFIPRILAAAEEAMNSARPVTLGVGRGESFVGVNRRVLKPDNKTGHGQDPFGIFDPRMTVLAFRDEAGAPVANLIHYGAHCTACGSNREISRDWAGVMIDALERETGAVTAFFNGTEGDVGPRLTNGKTTGDLRYAMELGGVAARDAVAIYRTIFAWNPIRLRVGNRQLQLPRKPRLTPDEARAEYELYREKSHNVGLQMKDYLERVLRSYEEGYEEIAATPMEQTVIALGNVAFASCPFELFSGVGIRVDGCFPETAVLSLSNANGNEGYFVTQDALCRGGYEVKKFQCEHIQPYCDDADWHLMTQTVQHVRDVLEGENL